MHSLFSNANYAIDVIYNKKTPFLKLAKEYNLKTKDGANMLLYQGVLAFELFYDHEFSFEQILPFMKRAF
jgi:shikimate dehydrogenase